MAYGNSPFYIWSDGEYVHFHASAPGPEAVAVASVRIEAIAQFVGHLLARDPIDVNELLGMAVAQSPDVFKQSFGASEDDDTNLVITPGFINPLLHDPNVLAEAIQTNIEAAIEVEDLPDGD